MPVMALPDRIGNALRVLGRTLFLVKTSKFIMGGGDLLQTRPRVNNDTFRSESGDVLAWTVKSNIKEK